MATTIRVTIDASITTSCTIYDVKQGESYESWHASACLMGVEIANTRFRAEEAGRGLATEEKAERVVRRMVRDWARKYYPAEGQAFPSGRAR